MKFGQFLIGQGNSSGCLGDFLQAGRDRRFCGNLTNMRFQVQTFNQESILFHLFQEERLDQVSEIQVSLRAVPCLNQVQSASQPSNNYQRPLFSTTRRPYYSSSRPNDTNRPSTSRPFFSTPKYYTWRPSYQRPTGIPYSHTPSYLSSKPSYQSSTSRPLFSTPNYKPPVHHRKPWNHFFRKLTSFPFSIGGWLKDCLEAKVEAIQSFLRPNKLH